MMKRKKKSGKGRSAVRWQGEVTGGGGGRTGEEAGCVGER